MAWWSSGNGLSVAPGVMVGRGGFPIDALQTMLNEPTPNPAKCEGRLTGDIEALGKIGAAPLRVGDSRAKSG